MVKRVKPANSTPIDIRSDYKHVYAEQARKLCEFGAIEPELAQFFGVSLKTISRWRVRYEEFAQALRVGKDIADQRVERSLFERANGYRYVSQQAIKVKTGRFTEKVEVVDVEVVTPPDTTACIFWLKNRQAEVWRDVYVRRDENANLSAEELRRQIVAEINELGLDATLLPPPVSIVEDARVPPGLGGRGNKRRE